MILLVALLLGATLGWVRGGKVRNLERLRIRYSGAIIFLFVVQAIVRGRPVPLPWLDTPYRVTIWCIAALLLALLAFANYRVRGFLIVGLGFALNLLVVSLNRGMPLALGAALQAGATPESIATGQGAGFYNLISPETALPLLGDVIGLPHVFGQTGVVLSVGDVLLLVGAAIVVAEGMILSEGEAVVESN